MGKYIPNNIKIFSIFKLIFHNIYLLIDNFFKKKMAYVLSLGVLWGKKTPRIDFLYSVFMSQI